MQVLSAPHFPFDNPLEVELYFHGKTFVFHYECDMSTQKRKNAAAHAFVDKSLRKERGPHLN